MEELEIISREDKEIFRKHFSQMHRALDKSTKDERGNNPFQGADQDRDSVDAA